MIDERPDIFPGYKLFTVGLYSGRPVHFTLQKDGWAEYWIFDQLSGSQFIDFLNMRDSVLRAKERLDAKIQKTTQNS